MPETSDPQVSAAWSLAEAAPLADFLAGTSRWLAEFGFHPGEALAVTASCRDEIAADLRAGVRRHWENAFDFSSLSGLPLAGATGMRAVLDHAPDVVGRSQVVIIAMPHVGVLADGTLGLVRRRGRQRPTTACGSLVAAASWAADAAALPLASLQEIDPLDPEQSLVRARLLAADDELARRNPYELALLAADLMVHDLWILVESFAHAETVDVALVVGILVNAPEGDRVQPLLTRIRVAGAVEDYPAGHPG